MPLHAVAEWFHRASGAVLLENVVTKTARNCTRESPDSADLAMAKLRLKLYLESRKVGGSSGNTQREGSEAADQALSASSAPAGVESVDACWSTVTASAAGGECGGGGGSRARRPGEGDAGAGGAHLAGSSAEKRWWVRHDCIVRSRCSSICSRDPL